MAWGQPTQDGQPVERALEGKPWTPEERNQTQLILGYQGLVRSLAWQVHRRLPPDVDLDDLIAFGNVGLVEAARDFDPGHGNKFITYAYYRIRGAIFDGLSKMRWFSLHDYHGSRYERLANEVLRLDAHETSEGEQASQEENLHWFRGVTTSLAVVYLATDRGDEEGRLAVDLATDSRSAPQAQVIEEEVRAKLRELIEGLPDEAGQLIRAVYFEGVTLEEAGRRIGISKAWASRLHAKTLQRLARALRLVGIGEELE